MSFFNQKKKKKSCEFHLPTIFFLIGFFYINEILPYHLLIVASNFGVGVLLCVCVFSKKKKKKKKKKKRTCPIKKKKN